MEQTLTPTKSLKLIFNDDVAILDFLADLYNKDILKQLDKMCKLVRENPNSHALFLYRSLSDNTIILILLSDPFGFNEGENKMIMYADDSLDHLFHYFKRLYETTSPDTGDMYIAIADIKEYLQNKWNDQITAYYYGSDSMY